MSRFEFLTTISGDTLGGNAEAFLQNLGGPTCLLFKGADTSRSRAFVSLLHGNEPSGTIALLRWLQSGRRPAVNIVCLLASVTAALEPPVFSHRMLPRARDLNRCFKPPYNDEQGALAQEILEILHTHRPEAVVDMHNTSGSGPSFGVCTHLDKRHDALTSLFTQRLIVSHLNLGALMDISEDHYPTVTIEVGGRLDDAAHETAYKGICRYFETEEVFAELDRDWDLEILRDPIRLELRDNITLTYDDEPRAGYDVTFKTDVEHHNFGTVSTQTLLGWAKGREQALFRATDMNGRCAVNRIIRIDDGRLYPAVPQKFFMITNNAAIAETDCLFYAVAIED